MCAPTKFLFAPNYLKWELRQTIDHSKRALALEKAKSTTLTSVVVGGVAVYSTTALTSVPILEGMCVAPVTGIVATNCKGRDNKKYWEFTPPSSPGTLPH
jgi:hypothetical protein